MNEIVAKLLPAGPAAVAEAARVLCAGGLVGLPTETVYGLAADATNPRAVAGIYAAKGRPQFNPLIVHVATMQAARRLAAFAPEAERLAAAFWPGPLTLVLPSLPGSPVADLARAGLDSVAIRMPSHPVARAVIETAGLPLAAPSANRSGRISATSAADVRQELGDRIDLIIDGGRTPVGVESTIVSILGDTVQMLRPGGLSRAEIERVLGRRLDEAQQNPAAPRAPGMLTSHYAPQARVRLDATDVSPGEALLAFGTVPRILSDSMAQILNLSPRGDDREAAANLFGMLRALDATDPRMIAVMPIPDAGLGEAINDRLRRAAAER